MKPFRDYLHQKIFINEPFLEFLSKFSVINIGAIAIGFFMVSRREPSESTIRHERTHLFQFVELLMIFLVFIYLYDLAHGMIKYRDLEFRKQQTDYREGMTLGAYAYRRIRFEQEAYDHQDEVDYLDNREWYSWRKYKV